MAREIWEITPPVTGTNGNGISHDIQGGYVYVDQDRIHDSICLQPTTDQAFYPLAYV